MHKVSIKYIYCTEITFQPIKKQEKRTRRNIMEYLFLRKKETTATSPRQRDLLFKTAERQWEKEFALRERNGREIDREIYKSLLYQLEIRKVFLNPKLSLKKLSMMIETNQTYLSNVVNRYFGCNLNELVNSYRIEYAKELLSVGGCGPENIATKCGFASRSPFYASFKKIVEMTPMRYMTKTRGKI